MQEAQQAGQVSNPRLAALLDVESGISATSAMHDIKTQGGILDGGQLSLSFGTSSSSSSTVTDTSTAVGSSLAGTNVAVDATKGDLSVTGSSITGTNIALQAAQNLNLLAAQNTSTTQTDTSASSTSFGVSFSVGGSGTGNTKTNPTTGAKLPGANLGLPTFSASTSSSSRQQHWNFNPASQHDRQWDGRG